MADDLADDAARDVATRLLDAQTAWVVEQLTGPDLDALIARDVADVLAIAATITLDDVADRDAVKQSARRLAQLVIGSAALAGLVPDVADAAYAAPAGDEHRLGDVVAREHVEAIITRVLELHQLQDRVMDRLAESPIVATIAQRYVTKLVSDFLQANREQAEKLPGVSSLFSVGLGAASKVRGAADKRLGSFLGDAQSRSTQFAIRRSNGAMREILRDAPVRDAALELWDLQADEPVSSLRDYLTATDLRDLLSIVHAAVVDACDHELVGALIDEGVDVVFERWGPVDLTSLLAELGLTADVLLDDLRTFAPPLLEAAARDGRLARLVRARLEPFFALPSTHDLLAGTAPSTLAGTAPSTLAGTAPSTLAGTAPSTLAGTAPSTPKARPRPPRP